MSDAEHVRFNPVMLAGELSAKPQELAQQYVDKFNEVGRFVIEKFFVRNPTAKEIQQHKDRLLLGVRLEQSGDEWFTIDKQVKLRLVVVEVTQHRVLPKDIGDMKIEKAKATIKLTNQNNK